MVIPSNQSTKLSYSDWNESVGLYCFNRRHANRQIRFSVDPLVLQRAAAEGPKRYHFSSPEAAAFDFCTVVSRQINGHGWSFGYSKAGMIPFGLAKLALQVFAVFRIAADDEGGSSYWATLHEILDRPIDRRGIMPKDLAPQTHQDNWAALINWANVHNNGNLGRLPYSDSGEESRRHVRLPMSHGLLRYEDILGLPRFFACVNVSPGEEVDPEDLLLDLRMHADDPTIFRGAHARRVLQDERLPLAAEQIAFAATQWDGQRVDLNRARGAVVRLWLTVHTTGGARVSGGLMKIDPQGQIGVIPKIGLQQLFGRTNLYPMGAPVSYQPVDSRLLIGIRSLLDGRYVEARYLRPGDQLILGKPGLADVRDTQRNLTRIATGERVDTFGKETCGLPIDWTMYRLRVRDKISEDDIPEFLKKRIKIIGLSLSVSGGLRVRGSWIKGAGPSLVIKGGKAETVIVDGAEYELRDGYLHPERCLALNEVGVHEAWLPGHHRTRVRFRVCSPRPIRFKSPVVDAGWVMQGQPHWTNRLIGSKVPPHGCVRGPIVEGNWPPANLSNTFAPPEHVAVRLVVALRQPLLATGAAALLELKTQNQKHPNLLVRQLARGVRLSAGARQEGIDG